MSNKKKFDYYMLSHALMDIRDCLASDLIPKFEFLSFCLEQMKDGEKYDIHWLTDTIQKFGKNLNQGWGEDTCLFIACDIDSVMNAIE